MVLQPAGGFTPSLVACRVPSRVMADDAEGAAQPRPLKMTAGKLTVEVTLVEVTMVFPPDLLTSPATRSTFGASIPTTCATLTRPGGGLHTR